MWRSLQVVLALGVVAVGIAVAPAPAGSAGTGLPSGFSTRRVISGLDVPTSVAFSSDRRVFVAEKSGVIKVFKNVRDETPVVAANLRTQVYNAYDRGLLSIALHPDFPESPWLYALYSFDADIGDTQDVPKWGEPGERSDPCPDPPGRNTDGCVISGRLARLTLEGNKVTGQRTLVHDWCQQFPSHSVGDLAFGPDGALYASAGDGAAFLFADYGQRGDPPNPCGDPPAGVGGHQEPPTAEGGALRSQDLRTRDDPTGLNGAIIRIDPVTGDPLPDNPVASPLDPNARRIIAYGMRNPFRMTVRPGTSEIYVGDTGWERFDEIVRVADAGDGVVENFGWPCYEGPRKQPLYQTTGLDLCNDLYAQAGAHSRPLASYRHDHDLGTLTNCRNAGGALSGVAFYEKGRYPNRFDGALFVADYTRRCMWVLYPGTDGRPDPGRTHGFSVIENVVDLETGPRGDLFYVDISGSIARIIYDKGNQPPVARIRASRRWGSTPLEVEFSGRRSSDPEGRKLSYRWDLDADGAFDDAHRARPRRVFRRSGIHKVALKVSDGRAADVDRIRIHAGNHPPKLSIDPPGRWHVGEELEVSARATDRQDGALPGSALNWEVGIRHCAPGGQCHLHPLEEQRGSPRISFAAPDHNYPASLRVRVKARDSWGLRATKTITLYPETSKLTLRSRPAGVRLVGGTRSKKAPFSFTAIVRSEVVLAAPLTHESEGTIYEFDSWSDGGARNHTVIARRKDATYRARYQPQ